METSSRAAYVVFAAEYGPDGKSIGAETKIRCQTAALSLIYNPHAVVLLAAGMADRTKDRPALAKLMQDYLMRLTGLTQNYFIICGSAPNTANEIDAVEIYLKRHPDIKTVTVVSTWYHLPRIITRWLFSYGRVVAVQPAWIFSPLTFKRAALEPAKMFLTAMPISNERKIRIGQWFSKRKII